MPGDHWHLEEGKRGYRIVVNGKVLRNSAGEQYWIPQAASKRIKLYVKGYPVLPKDAYLILGDNTRGSLDSTHFGLIHRLDLAGRLVRRP